MKKSIVSIKKTLIVIALLICMLCVFFVGCNNVVSKEDAVVITVEKGVNDVSLKSYMDTLNEKGRLEYTISKGMVESINGKANTTNTYWMLYTNDTENSNTQWGTYEYEGETFGSSTLGAEELKVKSGKVYIWVYQKF